MIITNKYNLPEPYFKSCLKDEHPRFDWDTFSVTELMKGTKEIVLNRRFYQELQQDCVDMIWSVFGLQFIRLWKAMKERMSSQRKEYQLKFHVVNTASVMFLEGLTFTTLKLNLSLITKLQAYIRIR